MRKRVVDCQFDTRHGCGLTFTMKILNVSDSVAFSSEKLKKVSLFDTEKFFCDVYCFEPGQSQKVHSHEGSDKIYYVLEGRVR